MPEGHDALTDEVLEARMQQQARIGACPHPELLSALREGVLPAEFEAPVRAHVGRCALCRMLMESELPAGLSADADARIRARIAQARRAPRPYRRWMPVAAGLVLAAGLAAWYGVARRPLAPAYPEVATIAVLAPPDSGPALVTRGAAATSAPTAADLLPAFQAYNRGDYAQAADAFVQIEKRFPEAGIAPLYGGVSELMQGRNAEAQRALLRALPLADASTRSAAAWYLAVADMRLQQPQTAQPLLRDLCGKPGDAYSARACELAARLPR